MRRYICMNKINIVFSGPEANWHTGCWQIPKFILPPLHAQGLPWGWLSPGNGPGPELTAEPWMARYWMRKCWLAWGNAIQQFSSTDAQEFPCLSHTHQDRHSQQNKKTNSCACRSQHRDTAWSYKSRAWKTSSRTKFLTGHLQVSTCIISNFIGFQEQLGQLATSSLFQGEQVPFQIP